MASILGIVGLIVMLIFGFSFMSDIPEGDGAFMLIWVLFGLGGIVYFIFNLISFSKSPAKNYTAPQEDWTRRRCRG